MRREGTNQSQEIETVDFVGSDNKELQRIQINSEILRAELESVSGVSVSHFGTPVVIAPPYKLVLPFLPNMKARINELEEEIKELNSVENNNKNTSAETEPEFEKGEKETEASDKKDTENKAKGSEETKDNSDSVHPQSDPRKALSTRLAHLKLLHDLAQDDLKDLIDLRTRITEGTLKSIAFEDLWHLFKPGDVIFCDEDGHKQLYRVYAVTGGQIQRRNPTPDEIKYRNQSRIQHVGVPLEGGYDSDTDLRHEASEMGMWTSFKVDCFSMAYDGFKYRPMRVCKKIKHYSGDRDITRLPMYPVHFHPNKDRLLKEMEDRGRNFMSSYGHKSYEGVSLVSKQENFRQEIESEVYIDFESYYRSNPLAKSHINLLRRSIREITESSEELNHADIILSGYEVDVKLADDFMATNRTILEPLSAEEVKEDPDIIRLLPYTVLGYVFRSRSWGKLERIAQFVDSRVLMILCSCDGYQSSKGYRRDLIYCARVWVCGSCYSKEA